MVDVDSCHHRGEAACRCDYRDFSFVYLHNYISIHCLTHLTVLEGSAAAHILRLKTPSYIVLYL